MRSAPARQGLLLAVICMAPVMVVIDSNIVAVALPAIRRDFGVSAASLQWVITAYSLTFGGFLLVGGRAADLHGRRRTLMSGLVVFCAASVGAALAVAQPMLVAARALQGLGAAVALPAALSLLTSTFREGRERNRALGVFGALISVALISGVAIGGIVTELVGWRGVFLLNPALGVLGLIGVHALITETARGAESLWADLPKAAAVTVGLVALLWGLTTASRVGWTSINAALPLLLGSACAAAGVVLDRRSRRPLATPELLARRTVAAATTAAMLTVAAGVGVLVVLSLYLQEIRGYGPLLAGLLLMPLGVAGVLSARVCASLADRFGPAPVLAGALVVQGAGVLLMVAIEGTAGVGLVLAGVSVMGCGHFAANVLFTALGTTAIAPADHGVAVGLINAAQQIGAAVGLALLVTIAAARTNTIRTTAGETTPAAIVAGYQWALAAGALLSLLAACLVVAIMRRR
jgi:MFS family permease